MSTIEMSKVAAVVILYNPVPDVLEKLDTYREQVKKTYLVDNSEAPSQILFREKIKQIANVEYICNNSNLGIAGALNIGAKRALSEGFEYILTMDQDGKASPGMVQKLLKIMRASDNIGITAPEHLDIDLHNKPTDIKTYEIIYTMTNGNLLSLQAYKNIGGFLDELFIDHVDHEFCLRLNKNGYKVIKTNETFVYHKLGKAVKKKIFNINFYPTFHPPIRLYYRTRNRFYIDNLYRKTFPGYVREDRRNMIREFLDIIICEKNLWKKFKMILLGYIHFKKKIFGKFEDAARR